MAYNEAQKRATAKYNSAHYERISLDVPKGTRDKWKKHADKKGTSLTSLIRELMEEDMAKTEKSLQE